MEEPAAVVIRYEQVDVLQEDQHVVLEKIDFCMQPGDFIYLIGKPAVGNPASSAH